MSGGRMNGTPRVVKVGWLVLLPAAFLGGLTGCPPPTPPPSGPTCATMAPELAGIDFAQLQLAVDMAVDVTDFNAGFVTADQLQSRYAPVGTQMQLITVPNTIYVYMLLTDDANQTQTIALSGTITFNQWRLDFLNQLTPDAELGINLHTGWRAGALAVRADLEPRLKPGYRVFVYGYSLGGATSAILSLYLHKDGINLVQTITAGQPRVTDAGGVALLNALPLIRVIAANDSVPWWPFYPYAHGDRVLFLLDGPFVTYLQPGDPDFNFAIQTPDDLSMLDPNDHLTYPQRISGKEGVPVCNVPFSERATYITPSSGN